LKPATPPTKSTRARGGLIEYGIAAHTQMSGTRVAYFGDLRWHKRRIAEVLE
jgi:hypothetical protein